MTFAVLSLLLALSVRLGGAAEPGLVGYWTFEEGTGTSTADLSGHGFTGTLVNGPRWVAGSDGGFALEFDGVDDRVDAGNPPELQITGALTLAAWVWVDSISGNGRIVTKGGGSGQRGWSLNVENFNAWAFQVAGNSTTTIAVNATNILLNQWIHLAGVFDPAGPAMRVYTNGVLAAERTSGVPAFHFNSPLNVTIGARPNSQTFFDGRVDEVRIYNRALTGIEINALLDSTPTPPSFLAEPSSQTVFESQPATFSATVIGSAPLVFQWFSNGVAVLAATNATYTIPVTTADMNGSRFAVRVTNALGSITSSNALLTVILPPAKVQDTRFSVDRGFFTSPFAVTITSETTNATIRYTLDGSAPSTNHGMIFTGPLIITNTTVLRAMAYADGLLPTDVDTQTYLFLSDVFRQPNRPPGFPSTWVNASGATVYSADYEMDPQILAIPEYANQLSNALTVIPSLSVVMDTNDLFGTDGLYSNGGSGQNLPWRRPCSLEMIHPDGRDGFQIDCGISPHSHVKQKRAFNLYFQAAYGPLKLRYPIFADAPIHGETAVDEFDHLILRCSQNDSWQSTSFQGNSARYATYTRDQMVRDTQLAVSGFGSRGTYAHLYLNGLYWGLYNVVERTDDNFAASYFGGEDTNWFAINMSGAIDGSATRFNTMHSFALGNNLALLNNWNTITNYLNVPAFVDYMIVQNYCGVGDWPNNNWYAANRNEPPGTVMYFVWDAEDCWVRLVYDNGTTLRSNDGPWIHPGLLNSSLVQDFHRNSQIARFYRALTNSAEFRLAWADRTYRHCFNAGALVETNLSKRWDTLNAHVEIPIIAESARWGDVLNGSGVPYNPFMPQHWAAARDVLRSNMVNAVSRWIAVCRTYGLYPPNDPPVFNQHGGAVPVGFNLTMTAGPGTVLFTLDGTDPRLPGDSVSPGAQAYAGPLVVTSNVTVKARLLTGGTWSALAEAAFYPPQDFGKLAITEIMFNPPRFGVVDGEEVEFLELKNVGTNTLDLTGLRFSEGIEFAFSPATALAPGAFFVLVRNTNQFGAKYPGVEWQGVYTGKLANEGERVAITNATGARVMSIGYGDRAPWPVAADGYGYSLVPLDPFARPSSDSGFHWRASANPGGSPGTEDPEPAVPHVVINEVLAAPIAAPGSADFQSAVSQVFNLQNSGIEAAFADGVAPGRFQISDTADSKSALRTSPKSDAIELFNPTAAPVDLSGWFLTDDGGDARKFRIPDGAMIAPGGFVVFTESDFNPTPGTNSSFALNSDGEQIYLFSADSIGNLTGWSHGFSFGASAPGISFGRHVISTGEEQFPAQIANTFGAPNAGPRVGPVVITEVHYHPAPGGDEFIELQNITGNPVALFDPALPTNTWRLSGLGFTFPANVTVPPNGLLVLVATNPASFRATHNVPAETPILGAWTGTLQDSGELLELRRPGTPNTNGAVPYVVADAVRYNDKAPWPVEPDGLGPSLERFDPSAYGNDPINWRASAIDGGTPGSIPVAPTTPLIAVGQALIAASAYVGENAAPEVFQVWNAGVSNLLFAVINTNQFLNVTPGQGASTGPVAPSLQTIDFQTAELAVGEYGGTVLVVDAGSGATNSPVVLPVMVSVLPQPTPEIGMSLAPLAATTPVGSDAPGQTFEIWNDGVGLLDYSITWDAAWLSIVPTEGSLLNINLPQSHTVQFHTAALPVGQYPTLITISAPEAVPAEQRIPVSVEVRSAGLLTAYNDFAWQPGQLASNITTHTTADGGGGGDGGGELVDFHTGLPTGIRLNITGGAYYGDWQAALGGLSLPGTDAHEIFDGCVDCQGFLSYASTELVLAFSGLDPSARYDVVLFGNRDQASLSNRLTSVTLEDAESFINASTSGAVVAGPYRETTTVAAGYNTQLGQVVRYTDVAPSAQGTFRLRVPAAGTSDFTRYYVNALRLQSTAPAALPELRISAAGDGLFLLSWTGAGYTLEQATAVNGPWTSSSNQTRPQIVAASGAAGFYRLSR